MQKPSCTVACVVDILLTLKWFSAVAKRNSFTGKTRGLFQYLIELAAQVDADKVLVSQDALATALAFSKRDVNSSLKELERTNIVSCARGSIKFIPPPSSWQKRYCETKNGTEFGTKDDTAQNLRVITRGQSAASSGITTFGSSNSRSPAPKPMAPMLVPAAQNVTFKNAPAQVDESYTAAQIDEMWQKAEEELKARKKMPPKPFWEQKGYQTAEQFAKAYADSIEYSAPARLGKHRQMSVDSTGKTWQDNYDFYYYTAVRETTDALKRWKKQNPDAVIEGVYA